MQYYTAVLVLNSFTSLYNVLVVHQYNHNDFDPLRPVIINNSTGVTVFESVAAEWYDLLSQPKRAIRAGGYSVWLLGIVYYKFNSTVPGKP